MGKRVCWGKGCCRRRLRRCRQVLGELCKEQAHLGLCERAEGEQGEQERVDAFALGGCEGVLEVLQERCDRVFFYRVVSFECYHSGWNLLQAALFLYPADVPLSAVHGGGTAAPSPRAGRAGVGAVFKSLCKDTYYSPHRVRLRRERPVAQSHSPNTMSSRNNSIISSSHLI